MDSFWGRASETDFQALHKNIYIHEQLHTQAHAHPTPTHTQSCYENIKTMWRSLYVPKFQNPLVKFQVQSNWIISQGCAQHCKKPPNCLPKCCSYHLTSPPAMRVPVSSTSLSALELSGLCISAFLVIVQDISVVLSLQSLMIHPGSILSCFFSICASLWSFGSLFFFLISCLFVFFLINLGILCILWTTVFYQLYILQIYSLSFWPILS